MSTFLPFIVSGIVTGSLYGLAGLGLVLTYRTSGVFNFAHGAIAAGAAFAFYTLHFEHGWPWPLAFLAVVGVFATVIGWCLERVTRPLVGAPDVVVVVATVGLMLGVEGLIYLRYGLFTLSFPNFLPDSGFAVQGVTITWAQVISSSVAVVGGAGLFAFLQRSRLGVSMRAVVDNPALASLSGEHPNRIRLSGWCIGAGAAAVAGILLAPSVNLDVNVLTLLVVQAFGACAVGRFSSLPLTFIGGLVVGILGSLLTRYIATGPLTGLAPSAPFIVLIAVLLVVPVRLLPGRAAPRRPISTGYRPMSTLHRRAAGVAGALVVLALPTIVGTKLAVWTTALGYVVVLASLALLTWASGQLSLCHAAFLAVGVTTMDHLADAGVPWLIALVLSGVAVIPVGALVALPAVRLSGVYLGLATMGFGILMQNVVYRSSVMFGPQLTAVVPRPEFGPVDTSQDRALFYIVSLVAMVCCLTMLTMWRGRIGRTLQALAESPTMLATHGLEVTITRLLVFCTAAFFAGVGGVLVVVQPGSASGVTFGPIQSLLFVVVLATCGTRPVRSPVLAAVLLAVVPGYATGFGLERQLLAFGIVALVAAISLARRPALRAWLAGAAATSDWRRARGPGRVGRRAVPV